MRRKELVRSAALLGIPLERLHQEEDPLLPDNPRPWPLEPIVDHLTVCVEQVKPTSIITFDPYGVSGHPNHQSVALAVRQWMKDSERTDIRCWELESVALWRKFIGPFDVILSLFSSADHVFFTGNPLLAHRTMRAHRSQYVWFRRLFVVFSRYSYLNTLRLQSPRR
mmetsp:Transcript_28101/g.70572  ORF Transcript_28101/g.70572 Transcript_28101/m.70572 type:complete len:167 (-) Transcript_28101:42-542(-)